MKKLMMLAISMIAVGAVMAVPAGAPRKAGAGVGPKRGPVPTAAMNPDEAPTTGKEAKVRVDQFPLLGQRSCLGAPGVAGSSNIGTCYTKPRKWIVPELKYTTYVKFQDQLTFTWHVLLETKSATENKGNKEGLSPYSYFTCTTTYFNIPQGSHAAGVCLAPSYLERYGEPKAIGVVITNAKGEELGGDCESEVKGIPAHSKFWENQKVMSAPGPDGKPMIERRQGLVDRSKTIWALVNPNDYEAVFQ